MKKTHKVITIPADFKESAPFFEDSITPGKLITHTTYFHPPKKDAIVSHITFKDCTYLHLYFLSEDTIQHGDWFVWANNGDPELGWTLERAKYLGDTKNLNTNYKYQYKVVATTNRGCFKNAGSDYARDRGLIDADAINEAFVNAFINANNDGNNITEVDLLMETTLRPVTRQEDGTVVVSQVKTYSKKDIDELANALEICLSHVLNSKEVIEDWDKIESAKKILAKYK
jgi:hypothetical protein